MPRRERECLDTDVAVVKSKRVRTFFSYLLSPPKIGLTISSRLKSDEALSRAISMPLRARSLPPLVMNAPEYRTIDHPYSLFEGLAGAVCA